MVETTEGMVSQELFDFALLVDNHAQRDTDWLLKCLAVFVANGLVEKHDLIGLKEDDYDCTLEKYGLNSAQKAWLRRCIEKANESLKEACAQRGEAAPANSEASAIKALVDTIKAEEVDVLPPRMHMYCFCMISFSRYVYMSTCTPEFQKFHFRVRFFSSSNLHFIAL